MEPYVAPPGALPLRDVIAALSPKSRQLSVLDEILSMYIEAIEHWLVELHIEKVFSARLPDGSNLGWSRDRRSRRWRFVIRDGESVTELHACAAEERVEIFTCGALEELLTQAGVLK